MARRPAIYMFRDQLTGVKFKATIPFVKNGIFKASCLLQETEFVSLDELYSFWGIADFIRVLREEFVPGIPDISYMDLREVLGWNLLQGVRIVDIELVPVIEGEEVIIDLVYNDVPEFWDIRSILNPYDSQIFEEEYMDFATKYPNDTCGYSGYGLSQENLIRIYEQRKDDFKEEE